jgi:hypothetical protein
MDRLRRSAATWKIDDLVRDAKITGFAIVSGDRHSLWAGYAASTNHPLRALFLADRPAGKPEWTYKRGDPGLSR